MPLEPHKILTVASKTISDLQAEVEPMILATKVIGRDWGMAPLMGKRLFSMTIHFYH